MRVSEWIVFVYVTYLVVTAWVTRPRFGARLRITLASAAILAVVTALGLGTDSWWMTLARDWAPGIYVLLGYWLSGLFFVQPDTAAEARLRRLDQALFTRARLNHAIVNAPRIVLESFELAYLFCYLHVPAGFATAYLQRPDIDVDRFWTIVLTSVFACYGALPWIPTRAPRQLEPDPPIDRRGLLVRRVNLWLLDRASIRVNTFPSGHAAGSLATALALIDSMWTAGIVFLALALSISVGSVIGRYHYAADAIAGVFTAIATHAVVSWFWVT